MTRDDIIRMAREAGLCWQDGEPMIAVDRLQRFAALVAAADRRKRMTLKERVLEALTQHPGGLTTVEVRRLTGGGIGARDTVYRLYNVGVLERTAPQPTPTGGVQYRYRLKS